VGGSGYVITDNVAWGIVWSSGPTPSFTDDYNLLDGGGGGAGAHDVTVSNPIWRGGANCAINGTTVPPGPCGPVWNNFLLAPGSTGTNAANDGTDMGAFGAGPSTPGGP
jgi:hypothetical protein